MAAIRRKGESFESLLRRFNREVLRSGFLAVARRKQFYEKPKTRREKKEEALRKKFRGELRKKRLISNI